MSFLVKVAIRSFLDKNIVDRKMRNEPGQEAKETIR